MEATNTIDNVSASHVLDRYEADEATLKHAAGGKSATTVVTSLTEAAEFQSAIDFLSHWLPPQHGIWWGCLCVWELEREKQTPEVDTAMTKIINWLQSPDDETRRELQQVEPLFDASHSIGMLAKAGLFSSGSMVAPELPPVEPPKFLYTTFVSGAVKMIAVTGKAEDYTIRNQQIMRFGQEVLQGVNLWQPTASLI